MEELVLQGYLVFAVDGEVSFDSLKSHGIFDFGYNSKNFTSWLQVG